MSIAGIGNNTASYYTQLSSGKRVNSAADDAAGLAIAEKLTQETNGYEVGSNNAAAGNDMLKVADGALDSITDSLQRMRELSLQASNSAIYGADEMDAIQQEIDQLKDQISSVASDTQFNEKNLLDGSAGDLHIASNPDGSGSTIDMANSTLKALGIADYNVTGSFDISVLDDALSKVSDARSSMGAQSNALEHVMNYNQYASHNLTASKSRIEDLDYGSAMSELKKNQAMDQYRIFMQKKQEEDNGRVLQLMR